MYVRLCSGLNDKGRLVPLESLDNELININRAQDHYLSIFHYNQQHYNRFKDTGSVSGITDVVTDKLVWDLDSESDLQAAQEDAITLCNRLIDYGISDDELRIFFSGKKGFTVEVLVAGQEITPDDWKRINIALAKDLKTNDIQILNASRILRVPKTKHQSSGLYKTPLSYTKLTGLSPSEIQTLASDVDFVAKAPIPEKRVTLPEKFNILTENEPMVQQVFSDPVQGLEDIDFSQKPKHLSNCKYALMMGFFDEGVRSHAFHALASTFRAGGFPKEITYRILKGVDERRVNRTGAKPYSKDKLWKEVTLTAYSENWQGGTYSCKNQPWLNAICNSLGEHRCKSDDESFFFNTKELNKKFESYFSKIDENTIKVGIPQFDKNIRFAIGTSNALLGSPASGKTSIAVEMLKNTSAMGMHSAFFSMDTYSAHIYQKMLQNHTGLGEADLIDLKKENPVKYEQYKEEVDFNFKNVFFCDRSGLTVQEIRNQLIRIQEDSSVKIKLVVVDYLECISNPAYVEENRSISNIAQMLKDLARDLDVCVITIVQPQKSSGDPSQPIRSMRAIKGASALEQSFAVITAIYREGFNPDHPENDQYITLNCLKNRMGPLFSEDCSWDGVKGNVGILNEAGKLALRELRQERELNEPVTRGFGAA